jgi:alkyl sulfatase BDS1-like metallo-beta-lactamase superfamily hydrolase
MVGARDLQRPPGVVRRQRHAFVSHAEKERAQKIVALAGGVPQMLSRVREGPATGDFRWAAELADCILAVDGANVDAKGLEALALTELGERQTSANARNYLARQNLSLKSSPKADERG